ncbi:MAG: hypothetical protein WBC93_12345 [Sulfitobacter sp.]
MADKIAIRLFCAVLGTLLTVFGAYIFYEKVYLAILDGHSHERVGIVDRADDPFSFWLGVCTYGTCSSVVIVAGLALLFRTLKKSPERGD